MTRDKRFIGLGTALVLVGCLAGWMAISAREDGTRIESDSDFGAPRSLDELNSWASVIVVAVAAAAYEDSVDIASGDDGSVKSRRVDQVRSFKVEQILKQDRALSPVIEVRSALSFKTWEQQESDSTTSRYGTMPVTEGRRYVLFLTTFSASTTGDALGYAGPVSVAELDRGTARLLVSDDVPDDLVPAFAKGEISLSAIEQSIRAPQPTPNSPSVAEDPNSVYAEAFARLIEEGSSVRSVADGERLLAELGMAPGSIEEPLFCRKVEAVLLDISGQQVDMKCR